MIVVGGVYHERSIVDEWDQVYGSGGRAAAALAGKLPGINLYTYAEPSRQARIRMMLGAGGVTVHCSDARQSVSFEYFHSLSRSEMYWDPDLQAEPIRVEAPTALRFGFLEGDAIVTAERAVFDPQSSNVRFRDNGSTAAAVATVLNSTELAELTGHNDIAAGAKELLSEEFRDDVVVVKCGPNGAQVHRLAQPPILVPAYKSSAVFKIGSGDIFSAIFAFHWADQNLDPAIAADLASKAVAHYVATRSLPIPSNEQLEVGDPIPTDRPPGRIYLAGPFFTTAQRWLVEELRDILHGLGCAVFSPIHEVGFGDPETVAPADIEGLNGCDAVLAIVDGADPGTWYEVGHARSRSIPVVVLAESVDERDLTMALGTGCDVARDLCSAAYKAVWASMR
ncbi:MAG: nucleoside 2-deoxyribosyltransferase [Rhodospirillaceae bacterium]|nr:MAG: nucleoside 2-deoxyribosyltransferase [Rhodospirillaceae bacterium]